MDGTAAPAATDGTGIEAELVIETIGLTCRFGSFVAVDTVSLRVARGASFGLLGPNGAGKSTTMKMLATLLPPSAGSARIDGFDVVRQSHLLVAFGLLLGIASHLYSNLAK